MLRKLRCHGTVLLTEISTEIVLKNCVRTLIRSDRKLRFNNYLYTIHVTMHIMPTYICSHHVHRQHGNKIVTKLNVEILTTNYICYILSSCYRRTRLYVIPSLDLAAEYATAYTLQFIIQNRGHIV